jgi:hypothetical protein
VNCDLVYLVFVFAVVECPYTLDSWVLTPCLGMEGKYLLVFNLEIRTSKLTEPIPLIVEMIELICLFHCFCSDSFCTYYGYLHMYIFRMLEIEHGALCMLGKLLPLSYIPSPFYMFFCLAFWLIYTSLELVSFLFSLLIFQFPAENFIKIYFSL